MKIILFGVLCAVLWSQVTSTWARLGETEEELKARYGTPTASRKTGAGITDRLTFQKDGITIVVTLVDGKSSVEIYTREIPGTARSGPIPAHGGFGASAIRGGKPADLQDLTAVDVDALLQANSAGLKWTRVGGVDAHKIITPAKKDPGWRNKNRTDSDTTKNKTNAMPQYEDVPAQWDYVHSDGATARLEKNVLTISVVSRNSPPTGPEKTAPPKPPTGF